MAAQLTHTGEQLDAAIRKVRAGYTDVSGTTAQASDVRSPKKFVSAGKTLTTGTMPNATVTASASISGSILTDTVGDYAVQITPRATLDRSGYIASGHVAGTITKYVKTTSKTITENGTYTPSGGLFSSVTVNVPRAKLNAPTASVTGLLLTITNGENGTFAQHFDIFIDGAGGKTASVTAGATATYDLAALSLSAGNHTVQCSARGSGMTDSDKSESVTFTVTNQLAAPVITVSGNLLTIIPVAHAAGYEIHADGAVYSKSGTTSGTTFDLSVFLAGYEDVFTITVYATAQSPYTRSPVSNAQTYSTVEKLAKPNITLAGAQLSIVDVDGGAESYQILVDGVKRTTIPKTS